MTTLFLDAGHTEGRDPGAIANSTTEHAEMAKLINGLAAKLLQAGVAVQVIPYHLLLIEKIAYVNARTGAEDLLVSFHMNAAGNAKARGLEVYFYGGSGESREKAHEIAGELAHKLGLKLRGVFPDTKTRHGRLGIIRDTKPWAFLVEIGFLTNKEDLEIVREKGVEGVYQSLKVFL